ncbi:MAG: methyltransferase [archaeon]
MSHYFSEKQDSRLKIDKITVKIKYISFELFSSGGVFSKDALDTGSRLLIENCEIGKKVLDMGCGIGVVGIAIKKLNPEITLTMADINERAVMLTKKNCRLHNIDANVVKSDAYSGIKENFDTILSNPPQAAGKEVCFKIIEGSLLHLEKGGTLQIVARHNKGGASLEKKMMEVFGNVSQIKKGSGFRIYLSRAL